MVKIKEIGGKSADLKASKLSKKPKKQEDMKMMKMIKEATNLVKKQFDSEKQNPAKPKKPMTKKSNQNKSIMEDDDEEEEDEEEEEMETVQNKKQINKDDSDEITESSSDEEDGKAEDKNITNRPKISDEMRERTIFVRNLHFRLSKECLEKFYSQYGQIENVAIIQKPRFVHYLITVHVHAYIRFADKKSAKAALKTDGCIFNGSTLAVVPCPSKEKLQTDDTCKIVVKNLQNGAQSWDLVKIFADCGKISNIYMPTFKFTDKILGGAVITFADNKSVEKALKKKRVILRNRLLEISRKEKGISLSSNSYPKDAKNSENNSKSGLKSPSFRGSNRGSGFKK